MLEFSTRTFETDSGTHSALIITPNEHVRVSASRLDELRAKADEETRSPIDLRLLAEGRRRSKEVQLTIFRGQDDSGQGSWDFEPGMDEELARELAYYLLRDQMTVYRGLFEVGLYINFHVEWPMEALDAYRHALGRLREELDPSANSGVFLKGTDTDVAAVDSWILRNGIFFFHTPIEKFMDSILPERWTLMERRIQRAQKI